MYDPSHESQSSFQPMSQFDPSQSIDVKVPEDDRNRMEALDDGSGRWGVSKAYLKKVREEARARASAPDPQPEPEDGMQAMDEDSEDELLQMPEPATPRAIGRTALNHSGVKLPEASELKDRAIVVLTTFALGALAVAEIGHKAGKRVFKDVKAMYTERYNDSEWQEYQEDLREQREATREAERRAKHDRQTLGIESTRLEKLYQQALESPSSYQIELSNLPAEQRKKIQDAVGQRILERTTANGAVHPSLTVLDTKARNAAVAKHRAARAAASEAGDNQLGLGVDEEDEVALPFSTPEEQDEPAPDWHTVHTMNDDETEGELPSLHLPRMVPLPQQSTQVGPPIDVPAFLKNHDSSGRIHRQIQHQASPPHTRFNPPTSGSDEE